MARAVSGAEALNGEHAAVAAPKKDTSVRVDIENGSAPSTSPAPAPSSNNKKKASVAPLPQDHQVIDETYPLLSQHVLSGSFGGGGAIEPPGQSQQQHAQAVSPKPPLPPHGSADNVDLATKLRSDSIVSDVSEVSIDASINSIPPLPGMKIRSHGVKSSKGNATILYDCSSKQALSGAKKRKGHYWIDIDADERDSDELKSWLDGLNLPKFVLSILAERSETWASQVVAMKKHSLAIIRYLPQKEDTDEATHLAALCLPNLLLTFTSAPRSEAGLLFHATHEYMHGDERLPSPTSSGMLLACLRFHVDRTSKSMRTLRSHVLEMDEIMDSQRVNAVSLTAIIDAKEQLLRLLSVAEEQDECLQALAGAASDSDGLEFTNLKGSLSVLLATAAATERMALRLEKQIGDLRQRHEAYNHDRMNQRLAVLTIISAIFLPLTLFSGIWGMNFDYMPELSARNGYFAALFLMFAVASSMLCCFYRAGWIERVT